MLLAAIPAFIIAAIALLWIGSFILAIFLSPIAMAIRAFYELKDQRKFALPKYIKLYFRRTAVSFIAISLLISAGYFAYHFFNGTSGYVDSEYPGLENPKTGVEDNPDVHQVDGYYRDNGTYVESYMRSDPDSSTSNNLNP